MGRYFFTSEAVCEGHPDKICDKISDYILDCALRQDKKSKMAVEATIKDNFILIYGEANIKANLNYEQLAKEVLKDIGYEENFEVKVIVREQSQEIYQAVEQAEIGAGDQGIMFGYACCDTEELMPLSIMLANKLCYELSRIRKAKEVDFLCPDGKSQVTVEYEAGKPKRVDTVIVAVCHKSSIRLHELREYVVEHVVKKVIPEQYLDNKTRILVNTSGSFMQGGPWADSGTTGRKIVSDSYGGMARVGGGCFSSKDPTKVDRTGAYYARYVAKNVVAHGYASRCEIQVAYAIGQGKPVSIFIDTYCTNTVSMENIYQYVEDNFDFSVGNMIEELGLLNPIYYNLACYGHFGRWDMNLSWEVIKD